MPEETDAERNARILVQNEEMRGLPIAERNRRIAYGVLSGVVLDGRNRFWAAQQVDMA